MRRIDTQSTDKYERARIRFREQELANALVAVMTTPDVDLIVDSLRVQAARVPAQSRDAEVIARFLEQVNRERDTVTATGRPDADKEA